MPILIISEVVKDCIDSSTISTINAAKKLNSEIHILIFSKNLDKFLFKKSKIEGISKILVVENKNFLYISAETISNQILTIVFKYKYEYILFASTAFGKDIAPRLAALLNVSQISDVIDIKSPSVFLRQIYSGRFLITVESIDPIKVLTICISSFNNGDIKYNDTASIEYIQSCEINESKTLINKIFKDNEIKDLSTAKIIVSGGHALNSRENFNKLIKGLADKLNGSPGASRSAVEAGYADNEIQIGQTGKIVAPKIYIAIGISGAIQHIIGMKNSKIIIAINNNPEANIFKIADYGIVGDLFEIVPKLIEKI